MSNKNKPNPKEIWVKSARFRCEYDTFYVVTRVSEKNIWYAPCCIDGDLRFRATEQRCAIANAEHELGELLTPEISLQIKLKMQALSLRSNMSDYCDKIVKALYNSNKVKVDVTLEQVAVIKVIYEQITDENNKFHDYTADRV